MNIFITGGTGFIGSHLVKKLLSKDYRVFCLVRNYQKGEILRSWGAKLIFGDIRDGDLTKRIPDGIDLVYHLVGILGRWHIPDGLYQDVHVRGTENLLRACVRLNIRRFIHCSTVGVLGPTGNSFFNENSPYNPTNIYEYTKAEAEKLVLKYANNEGIDITIVRPAIVYGPGDFHLLGLFKQMKRGFFPLIDLGRAFLHPTYIEDVVQGFDLCINNKDAINQIYILAGEKAIKVQELLDIIAKIMGISLLRINMSRGIANFIASILEVGGRAFLIEPPFTRTRVKFFTESKAYDISKAVQQLGYRPINLEVGLRRTIEWYKKNGYL